MVEQPDVPRHMGFGAGLFLNYSLNAVVLRDRATDEIMGAPLEHALSLNLLGSIGLFDFLELAVDLPIHALYTGDPTRFDGIALEAAPGVGDFRFVPKMAWWLGGSPAINFYLGGSLPVTFPTGNEEALRGAGGFTLEPRVLFGMGAARWRAVLNVGFRSRLAEMAVDHTGAFELTYGLAGTFGVLTETVPVDLQAEIVGGWHLDADHGAAPLEALAGAVIWPHPEWSIYLAGGPGLTHGLGSPDVRVLAGVRFGRRVPGRDRYADADGDRVPDYRDDCKHIPEDYDGFEDEDGCPELDNDGDGIVDDLDECPVHAEEPGGDGDGCPDRGKVMIRRGRLLIFGKILFATGSDEPLEKSHQLLDDIASTLKNNPEFGPLRVTGHTDNVGPAAFNRDLSQRRADAVKKALVSRGVPEELLSTRGYGEGRPMAPNETRAGRARNRRVEFIVIRR